MDGLNTPCRELWSDAIDLINMAQKKPSANVTSIEKICHGLGITLSQFFEEDAAVHHLTEEQKSLLTTWDRLSPSQRTAILDLIQAFLPE